MITEPKIVSDVEDYMSFIGQEVDVIIDRQLGSVHPKHGFVYPVNYGYLPETRAGDGEEVDAYILGVEMPVEAYIGVCIAVIHRKNDTECKLVVAPVDAVFTAEEIAKKVKFQEQWFDSEVVM